MVIESLLRAMHCSRSWKYSNEQNEALALMELVFQSREVEDQ